MSKGPGAVERKIADLFAASPDRALTVADCADCAFDLHGKTATRAQRLSATRAAHRVIRRILDEHKTIEVLQDVARCSAREKLGPREEGKDDFNEYSAILNGAA